jgi:hypothetical protein
MAGLIAMMNGRTELTPPSTDGSLDLKQWLKVLAETYQRNSSLSEFQIVAYQFALRGLSPIELTAACTEVLNTWTFVAMPPPAVILQAHESLLAAARLEASVSVGKVVQDPVEAARISELQWEKARAAGEEYRRKVAEYTAAPPTLRTQKSEPAPLVMTQARLDLLKKQQEHLLARAKPAEVRQAERLRAL